MKRLIEKLPDYSLPNPCLLNINIPADIQITGNNIDEKIKWTKLGKRIYRDSYKRQPLDENTYLFNLGGSTLGYETEGGTDFDAYEKGYVSITPLTEYG